MKIKLSDIGDVKVVSLEGRIDLSQTDKMDTFFENQFGHGNNSFVADLTAIDFISSDGLAALMSLRKKCAKLGGTLRLVCPPGLVREVFDVTRMATLFDISATLDEALSK